MSTPSVDFRKCRGHTLVELVLSLTLMTIIFGAIGSAMLFTARATPTDAGATATLVRDAEVLDRIAEDLSLAKYVTERSATAVTFVVADRTGDSVPDRIRYAWSGTPGDPLTYALNGGAAINLLDSVDMFSLDYAMGTRTIAIPAPFSSSSASETLIASFETTSGGTNADIRASEFSGQILKPVLSSGATGFQPTRIEIYARANSNTDGVSLVEIRDESSGGPGATLYADATVAEADLSSAWAWASFDLTGTATVSAGATITIAFVYDSGTGRVARLMTNADAGSTAIHSVDGGSSWTMDANQSLCYRLYGVEVASGSSTDGFDVTREHVASVAVSLQSTADDRSPLSRLVRMAKSPEIANYAWEAGFDADPTLTDLDGLGTPDWSHASGSFPTGELSGGVWTATDVLAARPAGLLTDIGIVHARMRSTTGEGPALFGPFHVNGGGRVLPVVTQLRQDGTGGQELIVYNEVTPTTPFATVTGLDQGWVDIKLVLLPNEDTLWLRVNGEDRGSIKLDRVADTGVSRTLLLDAMGADAQFAEVRYVVGGGSYAVVANAGTSDSDSALEILLKSVTD